MSYLERAGRSRRPNPHKCGQSDSLIRLKVWARTYTFVLVSFFVQGIRNATLAGDM